MLPAYRLCASVINTAPQLSSSGRYFLADLNEAVRLILHDKWSYSQVIDHFGWKIPKGVLVDRVHKKRIGEEPKRVGRPTLMTKEEEAWLASWVIFCFVLGVPVRRGRVLRKAAQILQGQLLLAC